MWRPEDEERMIETDRQSGRHYHTIKFHMKTFNQYKHVYKCEHIGIKSQRVSSVERLRQNDDDNI